MNEPFDKGFLDNPAVVSVNCPLVFVWASPPVVLYEAVCGGDVFLSLSVGYLWVGQTNKKPWVPFGTSPSPANKVPEGLFLNCFVCVSIGSPIPYPPDLLHCTVCNSLLQRLHP